MNDFTVKRIFMILVPLMIPVVAVCATLAIVILIVAWPLIPFMRVTRTGSSYKLGF